MKNIRLSLVLLPLAIAALSGLSGCACSAPRSTASAAQMSDKTSDPLPPVAEGPAAAPTSARSSWGAGASPSTF